MYFDYMSSRNPTSVRFDEAEHAMLERLAKMSGTSFNQVLHLAIRAGIPKLISGEFNPFRIQEEPPSAPEGNTAAPRQDAEGLNVRTSGKYSVDRNKPTQTKKP
jgi:hypothetical protein